MGHRIGDVNPAVAIHCQRDRRAQTCQRRREPVVIGIVDAIPGERIDNIRGQVHPAHAVIAGIADQQPALVVEEQPCGRVQIGFIGRTAVAAECGDTVIANSSDHGQFAVGGIAEHAVGIPIGDVHVPGRIAGHAGGINPGFEQVRQHSHLARIQIHAVDGVLILIGDQQEAVQRIGR